MWWAWTGDCTVAVPIDGMVTNNPKDHGQVGQHSGDECFGLAHHDGDVRSDNRAGDYVAEVRPKLQQPPELPQNSGIYLRLSAFLGANTFPKAGILGALPHPTSVGRSAG